MRNAETILGIIRNRGTRGLPVNDLYRQLWNPNLYLMAYGRIAKNDGALTPGATTETADGMKMDDIHAIIEALRFERYRWTPARRVYERTDTLVCCSYHGRRSDGGSIDRCHLRRWTWNCWRHATVRTGTGRPTRRF